MFHCFLSKQSSETVPIWVILASCPSVWQQACHSSSSASIQNSYESFCLNTLNKPICFKRSPAVRKRGFRIKTAKCKGKASLSTWHHTAVYNTESQDRTCSHANNDFVLFILMIEVNSKSILPRQQSSSGSVSLLSPGKDKEGTEHAVTLEDNI